MGGQFNKEMSKFGYYNNLQKYIKDSLKQSKIVIKNILPFRCMIYQVYLQTVWHVPKDKFFFLILGN